MIGAHKGITAQHSMITAPKAAPTALDLEKCAAAWKLHRLLVLWSLCARRDSASTASGREHLGSKGAQSSGPLQGTIVIPALHHTSWKETGSFASRRTARKPTNRGLIFLSRLAFRIHLNRTLTSQNRLAKPCALGCFSSPFPGRPIVS
jgi:hypothetical protein